MPKFLKQSSHIGDERLDLLEALQEHREQLLNVLVPLVNSHHGDTRGGFVDNFNAIQRP